MVLARKNRRQNYLLFPKQFYQNMDVNTAINVSQQSYDCVNLPDLASLVDKYVTVKLIKGYSYSGFLHAIDPVSRSIILMEVNKDHYQKTLIPGHAILNIEEVSTEIKPPLREVIPELDIEQISRRKRRIVAWFKKKLIPVSEKEDNIDLGSASILAPYGPTDIFASPVIALQIKKMIASIPEDFEP